MITADAMASAEMLEPGRAYTSHDAMNTARYWRRGGTHRLYFGDNGRFDDISTRCR